MTYENTTGFTIDQAFENYNLKHPQIYDLFKKFLYELIDAELAKHKDWNYNTIKEQKTLKTSSKLILNRIRWEVATNWISTDKTSEEKAADQIFDGFKINDAFTSRYARLFCDENPDWSFLFNFRALRS